MTEVVLTYIPWYAIPAAMVTGYLLSVLARWLLRRSR